MKTALDQRLSKARHIILKVMGRAALTQKDYAALEKVKKLIRLDTQEE